MNEAPAAIQDVCAICKQLAVLRKSHIVPAFIARWIKKDAPGTVFVNTETGYASQDISKMHLFCDDCEQRFPAYEGEFRNGVFDAHFKRRVNFSRGEYLTRFATSLAFRVALATLPAVRIDPPERLGRVHAMMELWRQYLLSPPETPSPSEHELFILNGRNVVPPPDISPELTAKYLIETIDPSIVASSDVVGVYCKLPSMLIWSPIEPTDRTGWRGTRVSGTGTIRAQKQVVTAAPFTQLFHERLRIIAAKRGLS